MKCRCGILILFGLAFGGNAYAERIAAHSCYFRTAVWRNPVTDSTPSYIADAADVKTVDALIKATYRVISGEAGPRNWNRFHSLFLPGARMGASIKDSAGQTVFRSFTPEDYQKADAPVFMKSPFYEEELGRTTLQFGNLAQVQSAYQFRLSAGGKIEQRGVNYFMLVRSDGRWWIADLLWQDEDGENPLPSVMIKK